MGCDSGLFGATAEAGALAEGRRKEEALLEETESIPRRWVRMRWTWVVVGGVATLVVFAGLDALRSSHGQVAAPTTTAARDDDSQPVTPPFATKPEFEEFEVPRRRRVSRTVGGVPFSFKVPTGGWEKFGRISINKSIFGPQGAEAIIFWASFPDGDTADPCAAVLGGAGRSTASLATAVATAPGTVLIPGPQKVTLGGRPAKRVVLVVLEKGTVGCEPGFFYGWQDEETGALWTETHAGDTIRVWIVQVGGTRLFIEAETSAQADSRLDDEVVKIVESIRFG
jgi:hypothetical protein